jgi:hypothetical protein
VGGIIIIFHVNHQLSPKSKVQGQNCAVGRPLPVDENLYCSESGGQCPPYVA